MSRIISSTEQHGLDRIPRLGSQPKTRGGAITRAAVEIADQLDAKYIVAFTQSGDSARRLSRLRPKKPVLAFTPLQQTYNIMTLMWGVQARLVAYADHTDKMTAQVDEQLLSEGLAQINDLVCIAAGSPPGQAGSTNSLRVHKVGDLADAGQLVDGKPMPVREHVGPWAPSNVSTPKDL